MALPSLTRHDDGVVACGTVLWRFRGRLQLTLVVKTLFAIVPDGVAAPTGQALVVTRDRHRDDNPARSLEAASDMAPYLARCDTLFQGNAYAPDRLASAAAVRLAVGRDGRPLFAKTIHVFGDRTPSSPDRPPQPFASIPIVYELARGGIGQPHPVGSDTPNLVDPADPSRATGFGPIARDWPARSKLLGNVDRGAIEAEVPEIPETMPWGYFQAAPPDQQTDHLRGDEWIVLDGLHPTLARVQTRLPAARGAARIAFRRPGAPASGQPVELVCDTLAIDGERQNFSLTWRGRLELPETEGVPLDLVVVAALETPGGRADWDKLFTEAAAPRAAVPRRPPAFLAETRDAVQGLSLPALPFDNNATAAAVLARLEPIAAGGAKPKPNTGTQSMSLDQLAPPPSARLPFPGHNVPALSGEEVPRPRPPIEPLRDNIPTPLAATPAPPKMIGPLATHEMSPPPSPAPERVADAAPLPATAPEPGLPLAAYPLERCAAITASMARRKEERAAVLERHELTQELWLGLEQHWNEVVRKDLERGRMGTLQAFDAAYVKQLEDERGVVTVEEYARLVVAAERGAERETLDGLGLPRGAMLRIKRVWDQRLASDSSLGKRLRREVIHAGEL